MAKDAFNKNIDNGASGSGNGNHRIGGSDDYINKKLDDIFIDDVVAESSLTAGHESNAMMRKAYPVKYDFIPSDDKYLNNEGECVVDQIDKIYGHLNNSLSRKIFINQCHSIENSNLDNANSWDISHGVRTSTLNTILKKHNISFYTFDI